MTDSSNITALSHVGVQVFGHTYSRWFTHIPSRTAQLQTRQFAWLFPRQLLLCLRSGPKINETQVVEVSRDDFLEFERMKKGIDRIVNALDKYEEE